MWMKLSDFVNLVPCLHTVLTPVSGGSTCSHIQVCMAVEVKVQSCGYGAGVSVCCCHGAMVYRVTC